MAWMNKVQMDISTPSMMEWASFIVCRYNGCCTSSSTCTTRANGYRDNAIKAFEEMGAEFWDESQRCVKVPDGGVIDQRSECYVAGGDPRYWHRETTGYRDSREWTGSTTSADAANFGEWIVKVAAGRYHVDVYLSGEGSKTAPYQVVHAGVTDTVMVDQTASGWVTLGDFDFAGTGDEHVMLGDNTGEPDAHVVFDAVRVLSLDDPGLDDGGCCDSGSGTPATSTGAALLLGFLLLRRRRVA
jgi:uncharacterized protein (TIGR03382 family)